MGMDTRAQIGIYEDENLSKYPVILINRNYNGHPTGNDGVVSDLLDLVPNLAQERGVYDAEWLGAQLIGRLIEIGVGEYAYGLSNSLHTDIRFYYAITPDGVAVYDARNIESFEDIAEATVMFKSAWVDPQETLDLEKEVRSLEDQLSAKKLRLEGLKRKQLKRK